MEFYPYRKGEGADIILTILKGGTQSFHPLKGVCAKGFTLS